MAMLDFLKKKKTDLPPAPDMAMDMNDLGMDNNLFPPQAQNPAMMPNISSQPFGNQQQQLPPNLQLGVPPMGAPQQNNPMQQLPPPQNANPQPLPNFNTNQFPPQNSQVPQPTLPQAPAELPISRIPEPPAPPMDNILEANEPIVPDAPQKDHVTLMTEDLEEIANNIIEEKFNKIMSEVEKIARWKTAVEVKIADVQADIKKIERQVGETQKSIMTKVSDYNKTIRNVDTELKALSKIFEKIMPTFTTNVKELSKIVSKSKTSTSISKRGRPRKN
jgi:hypothetical protein